MSKYDNPFTWAAALIDSGASVQDSLRKVANRATYTTSQLEDVNSAINAEKYAGKQVWNSTTSKPVWSVATSPSSNWVYSDGTLAHTPI